MGMVRDSMLLSTWRGLCHRTFSWYSYTLYAATHVAWRAALVSLAMANHPDSLARHPMECSMDCSMECSMECSMDCSVAGWPAHADSLAQRVGALGIFCRRVRHRGQDRAIPVYLRLDIGAISALYRLYIGSISALYRLYVGSSSALYRHPRRCLESRWSPAG